jgi:NAD(P)-dependent dehydrogenase (short-subunit alcohol dehydrogenase family)
MERPIAVVTGANRGIGFCVAEQLAHRGVHVILTSRDVQKGRQAVEAIAADQQHAVSYFQLDVTSEPQRKALYEHVVTAYGRLDILVNNAGVYLDAAQADQPAESVFEAHFDATRRTFEANVFGPWRLCQLFVPLMVMQGYGRIVNVSSGMGQLAEMEGRSPAYRLSKVSLNALTRIMADELQGSNVLVNAVCPGWCHTAMGGAAAPRSPAEGADTAVWLALLPDGGPSGQFFRDRKPIPW